MWQRWGLGPVFAYEWLMASRRWQMYAMRSAFVACILCAITFTWKQHSQRDYLDERVAMARFGEGVFYALISTGLTLVLLAAPAATAGAICTDKVRGTLLHLFITDLGDTELVFGKLAARLIPVLGLVGCSIPVMFMCILLGGIAPEALCGAFLVMLGMAVLGCALALTLSVWGTRSYEVLIASYLVWLLLLLAHPLWWMLSLRLLVMPAPPGWLPYANPYRMAFAPYASPGSVGWEDYLNYAGSCVAAATGMMLLAALCLRRVAIRRASRPQKNVTGNRSSPRRGVRHLLFGTSLSRDPIAWRELQRHGPSRWSRVVWGAYALMAVGFSLLAVVEAWSIRRRIELPVLVVTFQAMVGLLLLSTSTPAPLAEERAHGTLDLLLTTPLRTGSILWAKWRAAFRTVPRLVLLPTLTLIACPGDARLWVPPLEHLGQLLANNRRLGFIFLLFGLFFAYGTLLTTWGLAVATWTTRLGRAITWSIAAYVLMTVGWPFLVMLLTEKNESSMAFVMGSPFFGMAFLAQATAYFGPHPNDETVIIGALCWIATYLAASFILYFAMWGTFDRCVGRMSDRRPPRMPKPCATEHLVLPS